MYSKSSAMASLLSSRDEFHFVSSTHKTSSPHCRVQRELPPEPPDDTRQYPTILFERVGIEGGHDTAPAQAFETNDDFADLQATAGPRPFRETFNACNDEVRPQASAIVSKRVDRPVGRDEHGQNVESIGALVTHQSRAGPDNPLDVFQNTGLRPQAAIDPRLPRRIQKRLMPQQARMCAGRHDPTLGILNVDDSV